MPMVRRDGFPSNSVAPAVHRGGRHRNIHPVGYQPVGNDGQLCPRSTSAHERIAYGATHRHDLAGQPAHQPGLQWEAAGHLAPGHHQRNPQPSAESEPDERGSILGTLRIDQIYRIALEQLGQSCCIGPPAVPGQSEPDELRVLQPEPVPRPRTPEGRRSAPANLRAPGRDSGAEWTSPIRRLQPGGVPA